MKLAPRSVLGRLALEILSSAGTLKRASQLGAVVGIDWPAAAVQIPDGFDRSRVLRLLRQAERGMLEGISQKDTG